MSSAAAASVTAAPAAAEPVANHAHRHRVSQCKVLAEVTEAQVATLQQCISNTVLVFPKELSRIVARYVLKPISCSPYPNFNQTLDDLFDHGFDYWPRIPLREESLLGEWRISTCTSARPENPNRRTLGADMAMDLPLMMEEVVWRTGIKTVKAAALVVTLFDVRCKSSYRRVRAYKETDGTYSIEILNPEKQLHETQRSLPVEVAMRFLGLGNPRIESPIQPKPVAATAPAAPAVATPTPMALAVAPAPAH